MTLNYPDLDGILWFNDGYQGNSLNTLSILGKKYYDRFNYIYHNDYKSVWSDNEFMSVGKILNRQTYIDQVIIKHDHPVFVKGKKDIIHKKNSEDFDSDYKTFLLRQSNNFYL